MELFVLFDREMDCAVVRALASHLLIELRSINYTWSQIL